MLDWFTGYVGYDASQMRLGEFYEVDAGGALVRRRSRWETAVGSYEAGLQVTRASAPEPGRDSLGMVGAAAQFGFLCANPSAVLKVSGNPSKYLQGHNAAGPPVAQLGPVLQAVARSLSEGLRPVDADSDVLPSVHRSRVDVTTACDLGSHEAVHAYIYHLQHCGRSHQGRGSLDDPTSVYFQKTSRKWTLKFYCKHCELKANPPAVAPELYAELLDWTRSHLRVELVLRRPELIHRGTLDESLIWDFVGRLQVSSMAPKERPDATLRPAVRACLALWYDGHDLKGDSLYPRPTRYKYRREILTATGIDIFLPRVEQQSGTPALVALDELREREVTLIPDGIQRSLFGAAQ